MAYATLIQIKAGWTVPAGMNDSILENLLSYAETMINKWTNDNFEQNSLELIVDGSGTEVLWLGKWTPLRCISVSKIEDVEYNSEFDTDWYKVYERYLRMVEYPEVRAGIDAGIWPEGALNIKITGVFGWQAVPSPINRATILLVRLLAESDSSGSSPFKKKMKSEKIGDYSYTAGISKEGDDYTENFTGDPEIDRIINDYLNRLIQPLDSGDGE